MSPGWTIDCLVSAEGLPSASIFNGLDCQTNVKAHFDPQPLFPALSNLIVERDDGRFQIALAPHSAGPLETRAFAQAVAAREGSHHAPVP
jgi:hypothetical protein